MTIATSCDDLGAQIEDISSHIDALLADNARLRMEALDAQLRATLLLVSAQTLIAAFDKTPFRFGGELYERWIALRVAVITVQQEGKFAKSVPAPVPVDPLKQTGPEGAGIGAGYDRKRERHG